MAIDFKKFAASNKAEFAKADSGEEAAHTATQMNRVKALDADMKKATDVLAKANTYKPASDPTGKAASGIYDMLDRMIKVLDGHASTMAGLKNPNMEKNAREMSKALSNSIKSKIGPASRGETPEQMAVKKLKLSSALPAKSAGKEYGIPLKDVKDAMKSDGFGPGLNQSKIGNLTQKDLDTHSNDQAFDKAKKNAEVAGMQAYSAEKEAASADTVEGYRKMWNAALKAQDAWQAVASSKSALPAFKATAKLKVEQYAASAAKAQKVMNATQKEEDAKKFAAKKKDSPMKAFSKQEDFLDHLEK